MSYARFGWDGSDVYVFLSGRGLECCGCALQDTEVREGGFLGWYLAPVGEDVQTVFTDTQAMVDHLDQHIHRGHIVPDDVIPRLWAEDTDNFQDTE